MSSWNSRYPSKLMTNGYILWDVRKPIFIAIAGMVVVVVIVISLGVIVILIPFLCRFQVKSYL